MELAKLFAQASRKLIVDFETSADFHNPGSMGSYREDAIKTFLSKRLPQRYGVGGGHVLGPILNESKQLDCVIIDNDICPALVVSDSLRVEVRHENREFANPNPLVMRLITRIAKVGLAT